MGGANRSNTSVFSSNSTVAKGAKFEDEVANLYRLLGADVVQNIEIVHKKIDMLATFTIPGSANKHRVLVECKNEKRKVADNQRVMQFHGLLQSARKLGVAESAEIITRVPWSDMAKGFANENGIGLLTFREKLAQLIDFKPYLASLIERFDVGDPGRPAEPPLGAYYVIPRAERIFKTRSEHVESLDEYLMRWIEKEKAPNLAILGEYGTGKTSACQKLAHDLASRHLELPATTRIPILLNLREFTKKLEIEALITSFLDKECEVTNPRFRLFDAMNKAGMFIMIFDAFDEMAVKVDRDTLEMNLQEIEKLAAPKPSKVIITSRIEYFVSVEEEEKALHPKGDIIETRQTQYEPLVIKSWDVDQIDSFLLKRVPLIQGAKRSWLYYRNQIRAVPELSDLSGRPVLLEMIARTLPELVSSGKRINRPNLYRTYLDSELQRQKILKKRELLLSKEARFSLLERLAIEFFEEQRSATSFDDAANLVRDRISPPKNEVESYTRDFLACSFLIRKGDEYRFSHNSIMEYLIAKALIEEIKNAKPNVIRRRQLPPVVAGFLADMKPDQQVLWKWLESKSPNYLGGNAATLLCKLDKSILKGRNLSGTSIVGADLRLADLTGTKLKGASLSQANLSGAKFLLQNLSAAVLSNVVLSVLVFGETRLGLTGEYAFHEFSILARSLGKLEGVRNFAPAAYKVEEGRALIRFEVQVTDLKALTRAQGYLQSLSWIKLISVDVDEAERLYARLPSHLRAVMNVWSETESNIHLLKV